MLRFVLAVGAVMAFSVLASAQNAQASGVGAYWNDVTQQALEFERSGTTVTWENGYGRGETTPRPAFTNASGFTCREFEVSLRDSGQNSVDTACRGGDGVWFLQRGQAQTVYVAPPPPRVIYQSAPVYYAPPPVVYYPYHRPHHSYYPRPYYPSSGVTFVFRSGGGRDYDRGRHRGGGHDGRHRHR